MKQKNSFSGQIGFVFAAAGSAVGVGNLWRFPYLAAKDGGGLFLIIYLVLVLTVGFVLLTTDIAIGRKTGKSAIYAYESMRKKWKFLGVITFLVPVLIMTYYAVIGGWILRYIVIYLTSSGKQAVADNCFTSFISSPSSVWYGLIFMFLTALIVYNGVEKGIERSSKVLMPLLFILVVVLAVCSVMLPGAEKGIEFLLTPDFSKITPDVFLGAMGQAFFSLSLGMGCLSTYASYFGKETRLGHTAMSVGLIDTFVAVLAGLIIFPAAFSVGIEPDAGPSLIFITLPNVFQQAFSGVPLLAYVCSILFYVLLALAALTSTISLHEVSTAFLHEKFHFTRSKAATIITVSSLLIGIVSSLALGDWSSYTIAGMNLFDALDFLTAKIMLPLGGMFAAIFVGWVIDRRIVRDEVTNYGTLKATFYPVYIFILKFIAPIGIALIFMNELGLLG